MSHQQSDLTGIIVDRPFTPDLRGFAAWLETMPPQRKYDWSDCSGRCLVDQFFAAAGYKFGTERKLWNRLNDLAGLEPHTFGAALTRARALLAK